MHYGLNRILTDADELVEWALVRIHGYAQIGRLPFGGRRAFKLLFCFAYSIRWCSVHAKQELCMNDVVDLMACARPNQLVVFYAEDMDTNHCRWTGVC